MGVVIHLDTNILIDLVTSHSAQVAMVHGWLKSNIPLAASAVTWSEFCNGPIPLAKKQLIEQILGDNIIDFTQPMAETASFLFNKTGRRSSHSDCMIAATAIISDAPLCTQNIKDFERFIPFGLHLHSF